MSNLVSPPVTIRRFRKTNRLVLETGEIAEGAEFRPANPDLFPIERLEDTGGRSIVLKSGDGGFHDLVRMLSLGNLVWIERQGLGEHLYEIDSLAYRPDEVSEISGRTPTGRK